MIFTYSFKLGFVLARECLSRNPAEELGRFATQCFPFKQRLRSGLALGLHVTGCLDSLVVLAVHIGICGYDIIQVALRCDTSIFHANNLTNKHTQYIKKYTLWETFATKKSKRCTKRNCVT